MGKCHATVVRKHEIAKQERKSKINLVSLKLLFILFNEKLNNQVKVAYHCFVNSSTKN